MSASLPTSFHARTLAKAYPATHTYKLALYDDVPNLCIYSPDGECKGEGYTAGGVTLTGYRIIDREDGADLAFNTQVDLFDVSVKTRGALVYDADNGDVLCVEDFGRTVGVIGGIFTVNLNKDGVVGIGKTMEVEQ